MKTTYNASHKYMVGLFAASLSLIFVSAAHSQILISTYPSWNGTTYEDYWGVLPEGTSTYGQTFNTPSDNVLNNFTFSILNNSSEAIAYQPFVYAWNGLEATGPALFSGAISSVPISSSFENITINTGNLTLQTGQEYVAFLTTSTTSGPPVGVEWGIIDGVPYNAGSFVYDNNSSFSQLTTSTWSDSDAGEDLAFSASFSPASAPEPSTWALLLGGLGALACWHSRSPRETA